MSAIDCIVLIAFATITLMFIYFVSTCYRYLTFCKIMEGRNRLVSWSEIRQRVARDDGTLILVESPGFGPRELWWTHDELQWNETVPVPELKELLTRINGDYLDVDKGKAVFVCFSSLRFLCRLPGLGRILAKSRNVTITSFHPASIQRYAG